MTSAMCARAGRASPGGAMPGRAPAKHAMNESRPRRFAIKTAIPDRDGAWQEGDACHS
jgi:hypothetical protein